MAVFVLIQATACSKSEDLTPLNAVKINTIVQSAVSVNFCTDPAYTPKEVLKMVVVLDHSGSNKLNYEMDPSGDGAPLVTDPGDTLVVSTAYATDPTGVTRYGSVNSPGTLLNYLQNVPVNNPSDPTRYFALVDFNASVETYPSNATGFTSDTVGFFNYVQADALAGGTSPNDGGDTDYIGAMTNVYNIINNDILAAKSCAAEAKTATPTSSCPTPGVAVASSYVVVFMSDGAPITNLSGVSVVSGVYEVDPAQFSYTIESQDQILSQVATMIDLEQDSEFVASVNMFTVYYYAAGNIDQTGQTLLANMAKAGNGIAYDALSGSQIDYADFQPPTKTIKPTLADIFVTNSSVTWWSDGLLHKDTDMDGLPDDVETTWGSDPNNKFTANNGVSDYVRYVAANGAPCTTMGGNGICADPVTNYKTGVCSSIHHTSPGGVLTFKSSDPDGLNDCEKIVLNDTGGIDNPDSNGDLLPDWLEFLAGVPFQLGTAPAVNTPDQDGYTVYQKVKYSLPQNVPEQEELNLTPANYSLTQISTSATQDCYQLSVTAIPTIGSNNTIRVDVMEKANNSVDQTFLYRVGKKTFSGTSLTLSFDDWNNAAEIAAGTWSTWP